LEDLLVIEGRNKERDLIITNFPQVRIFNAIPLIACKQRKYGQKVERNAVVFCCFLLMFNFCSKKLHKKYTKNPQSVI
jgi:hypothetical protein